MTWLILFLCFLGLELAAGCLISLWFCVGCLGAWLGSLGGIALEGQLALFVSLSFLTLILIRPAAILAGRRLPLNKGKGFSRAGRGKAPARTPGREDGNDRVSS